MSPTVITGDTVHLDDAALVHQIGRVLRLHPGDRVLLLDGVGNAYTVLLTEVGRTRVTGSIKQRTEAGGEPRVAVTLYLALLRPERFEWVLQKGTELGVSAFVPVTFAHALPADRADERKLSRWSRIIQEAAEQSCRGCLPRLAAPVSFAEACAQAATSAQACILWEGEAQPLRTLLRQSVASPTSLAVLTGPEGGITPAELTTATEHGIIPVSLGPRILRAETAPIAAIAAIFYELE